MSDIRAKFSEIIRERKRTDCIWLDRRLKGFLRDQLDAEDVFQNAVDQAFRRIDQSRDGSPSVLSAWFGAILRRQLAAEKRRLQSQKRGQGKVRIRLFATESGSMTSGLNRLPGNDATPSSEARGQELVKELEGAMELISDIRRKVLVMKYHERMTDEEIGREIGRTPTAVRGLVHHGIAHLRKLLEESSQ